MLRKNGRWYADWRDENGKRHRKSFATRQAAKAHAKAMRKAVQQKKAQRRAAGSHRSSRQSASSTKARPARPHARSRDKWDASSGTSPRMN
jgi:hypothetical protein